MDLDSFRVCEPDRGRQNDLQKRREVYDGSYRLVIELIILHKGLRINILQLQSFTDVVCLISISKSKPFFIFEKIRKLDSFF